MQQTIARKRTRLEMQGFVGLDDATVQAVDPWLRLAPAICLVWTAAGLALGSAWVLWTLVPFAVAGAVLRNHPFDAIYNQGLRRLTGGPRLPRYGAPRRSGCVIASVWLTATGWLFHAGLGSAATVLGVAFLIGPTIQVTTGFCLPSYLYRRVFGQRPQTDVATPLPVV